MVSVCKRSTHVVETSSRTAQFYDCRTGCKTIYDTTFAQSLLVNMVWSFFHAPCCANLHCAALCTAVMERVSVCFRYSIPHFFNSHSRFFTRWYRFCWLKFTSTGHACLPLRDVRKTFHVITRSTLSFGMTSPDFHWTNFDVC